MGVTYDKRNRTTLNELAPNTKKIAYEWYEYCVRNSIDILIYDARRTVEEQKANVASGASKTMRSYHLVGQAIDFVPIINGKADWGKYGNANIMQAVREAKRLGLTWGGDWKSFVDKPHFQYEYKGYGTDKVLDKPKQEAVKPVVKPVVKKNRYSDVGESHTAYNALERLSKLGIINGFIDGSFKPNEALTRSQMAIIIDRLVTHLKG